MTLAYVPKETDPGESRVAAIPETVKALVKAGLTVAVEAKAGLAAGFTDEQFREAGAEVGDASRAGEADLVLGIRAPNAAAIGKLKAGAIVCSSLQPVDCKEMIQAAVKAKVTTFGMELVPRITRAQKMDVLSSQATCSGYQAVLMAAAALPRFFPLFMTAAGTIAPSKVFVLGAGVAGLQAIATARRLGAVVEATDVRPAVKEQVESLGAKFVNTSETANAETAGGYAKEATAEELEKQRQVLADHVADSDVVITTAAIPGRKAPVLIQADMVKRMRTGSVIVDLAVATGGNVEGSVPDEHVVVDGVTIIGETNLAGLVASDASRMWARNVLGLVQLMINEGKLVPNWEDEVLAGSVVTHDGEIKHDGAKQVVTAS